MSGGSGLDDETFYAQGRRPGRTYASRSFEIGQPESRDYGTPARFVYRVFDVPTESEITVDGDEYTVTDVPGGRYQVKVLLAREAGQIKDLWIQRVPAPGTDGRTSQVLNLKRDDAMRFAEFMCSLASVPMEADAERIRVDDDLLRDVFADPDLLGRLYEDRRDAFRAMITSDASARDVIAITHRRQQVTRFRRLLSDREFFDDEATRLHGPERVWQEFLESNPWVLGVSLGAQLFTGFDSARLEQVVAGASIAGPGKRADALLKTAGRVRSLVFAEIKTHATPLLDREYRPGCWSVSREVSGGVAQVQGTVQRAVAQIGQRLPVTAEDGSEVPGEYTYLLRPRSFLIVGDLGQFIGQAGGHDPAKFTSFELFRRQLLEPEIITFDELLARAEWLVDLAQDARDPS
ncbi:Shedu immune nuclease family protein [Cellulomonas carbonis]|uniref:Shedu protein SduA C-terminal domain-containing protein n=1 Tax=Cellulomonas carbonis T26 TaxID=947969 RepID=A0A0A0BTC3_9CELL|nr:Shedu immune nuclease family protein [Cellulomonas carbonis]KGM11663.1 hypothetical protein N868_07775 [Cellulomonas carbonis T26]GGB98946.1 hypothetical protein GCM10010972_09710 [Cellulomonas carbonis]